MAVTSNYFDAATKPRNAILWSITQNISGKYKEQGDSSHKYDFPTTQMNTTSLLKIQQRVELAKTPATGHTQLSHTSDSPLLLTNGYLVIKIVLFQPINI